MSSLLTIHPQIVLTFIYMYILYSACDHISFKIIFNLLSNLPNKNVLSTALVACFDMYFGYVIFLASGQQSTL